MPTATALFCPTCCGGECIVTCPADPDPELDPFCCGDDPTPLQMGVTIVDAVASSNRQFDTAGPFHVWAVGCDELVGTSWVLDLVDGECRWRGTFDVLGLVHLFYCVGNGTGGGACVPNIETLIQAQMTITVESSGLIQVDIAVECSDTSLVGAAVGLHNVSYFVLASPYDTDFTRCCRAFTQIGDPPTGGEDWNTLFMLELLATPCP